MTYSKAAKRRLRKGRPILPPAEREPNGRKSRRKAAVVRRKHETEAEIKMVALSARMKRGLCRAIAERPEAGSAIGRVHISFEQITYAHYLAAIRYGADHARYYSLCGIPYPSARAQDLTRVHGMGGDNVDSAIKAKDRVIELGEAVRKVDRAGRPVASTLRHVCILDDDTAMHLPHMVKFLFTGLDELVEFYGIDRGAEPEPLTTP